VLNPLILPIDIFEKNSNPEGSPLSSIYIVFNFFLKPGTQVFFSMLNLTFNNLKYFFHPKKTNPCIQLKAKHILQAKNQNIHPLVFLIAFHKLIILTL
jgi:hypothetical protein